MTEELKGQMSIVDCFGPDIWSGRTCREHYLRPENETEKITEARTSKPSSRKSSGLSKQMLPMFLYLKTGDGLTQDVSWESERTDSRFPLLTEYMIRSFGECPSEENVSLLSQILEDSPLPKYSLSARACQGILRRAENRGKELPSLLKETLLKQSVSKNEQDVQGGGKGILIQKEHTGALSTLNNQSVCYGIGSYDSNSMKSDNPHSGIYEADTSRTLDLNGGNPACNQRGIAVVSIDEKMGQTYIGEEVGNTLSARDYKQPQAVICGEGGAEPITASKAGFFLNARNNGKADTLVATDYKDPQVICYGLDRASFNQGKNAQYDFSVTEEQAQTLVAKGPGGVLTRQSVPYVPEITKE